MEDNKKALAGFMVDFEKCNVNAQSQMLEECNRMLEIELGTTASRS
jgi:hypothetical protein